MLVPCALSPLQRQYYKATLENNLELFKSTGHRPLMNVVMQLRKVANHPYLFDGAEPAPGKDDTPADVTNRLVRASGKLALLDKMLAKLREQGHRVLIFSQMSRMLDILEDFCHDRGFLSVSEVCVARDASRRLRCPRLMPVSECVARESWQPERFLSEFFARHL